MGNDLRKQLEELKDQNKRLKTALLKAYTDPLTGLWNRTYFEKFKVKIQNSKNPIGIVYIDANKLKYINDKFGHTVGDKYLADTGKLLTNSTKRKSDFAFRIGGDEFLLILALGGNNPGKGLDVVLNRISTNLKNINKKIVKEGKIEISIAIGSSIKTKDLQLTKAIQKAEDLMYKHKKLQKQKDPTLAR